MVKIFDSMKETEDFIVMIASPCPDELDDVVVCARCHHVIERGELAYHLFVESPISKYLCEDCRADYQ